MASEYAFASNFFYRSTMAAREMAGMAWRGFFGWQVSQQPDGAQESPGVQMQVLTEPRELLHTHRQRLGALRLESGFDAESFERLIGAALYQVAEYVHLLPATRAENHAEPGGLFRLAVESACLAFRCADGKFLGATASTPIQDRERDRVRRYAAFLSGLLLPLGRCATHARVCAHGREELWNPYREPLWVWARRVDATRLDIQWCRTEVKPAQAAAIWIAARIVPPAALHYLQSAEDSLAEKLLQVLNGEQGAGRLNEIVRQAYQGAIDQDLARLSVRENVVPQPRGEPKQSIDAVKPADVQIAEAMPTVQPALRAQEPERVLPQPLPEPPDPGTVFSPPEDNTPDFKALNRFGEAGQILKALGQRMLAEPGFAHIIAVEGGVAIAYPEAITPFCQHPRQFLLACEAQGLLVADNDKGRRTLRARSLGQTTLPEHYVVLSARVAKYLPLRAYAST